MRALKAVNLSIKPGEFVGIAGKNGSGKTTLARLLNGLLLPSAGSVMVNGMDTRQRRHIREIRRQVAMVFQNPDNQLVSPVIEEEIAFGPENLNLPLREIEIRVEEALQIVGLEELRHKSPHMLSGGQKQRVAIAAALAMRPACLVLDEPTSMLDQTCRQGILDYLRELNNRQGITIILISHNMEDLAGAGRIIVLQEGSIVRDAPPWEIFNQAGQTLDLKPPNIVRLAQMLRKRGCLLDERISTLEQMENSICRLLKSTT
ncbi:energy-coupling factor transporter ATPase [Pelotomaculum terephthalicicum JT]|uniref:energy-coupling factor transporter ATPase n=1 Tax=Pelotomaculum TaxID=191373 RepID=UPI001F0489A2|nr:MULTISPECIES: energy-coupling factor transporter ATPase [Pelotomaculum]MCG9968816.1 energy-coupling factor transporter ATPase [Pelotomaculum terephthalicicum JT]